MSDEQPRSREQRKADTLAKLAAPAADVWVATAAADTDGQARSYLVPLSLAWRRDMRRNPTGTRANRAAACSS